MSAPPLPPPPDVPPPPVPDGPDGPAPSPASIDKNTQSTSLTTSISTGKKSRSAAAAFGDSDSEDESTIAARRVEREEQKKKRKQEAYEHCQAATNPSGLLGSTAPTVAKTAAMAMVAQIETAIGGYNTATYPAYPTQPTQPTQPPQPVQSASVPITAKVEPIPAVPTPPAASSATPATSSKTPANFAAMVALAKAKAQAIQAKMAAGKTPAVPPTQTSTYVGAPSVAPYLTTVAPQADISAEDIERKLNPKIQFAYDSDEDTEGGTWEHKKRALEMKKTQEEAVRLTEANASKHHIADFLPKDEQEKFMEKFRALREGREPNLEDYQKYKIQQNNIGFQMLQKQGWSQGSGLGAAAQGITAPINKGATSLGGGVGATTPSEVSKDDDIFSLYRKRNMLAYKYRPNPLNNPRRPY